MAPWGGRTLPALDRRRSLECQADVCRHLGGRGFPHGRWWDNLEHREPGNTSRISTREAPRVWPMRSQAIDGRWQEITPFPTEPLRRLSQCRCGTELAGDHGRAAFGFW